MHSTTCLLVAAVVVAAALAAPSPQEKPKPTPQEKPKLTFEASQNRFPGGHSETFKVTQDAWVSKNGNWKAGGYVQHDRMKFGGQRDRNTHGGISITGRF